MKNDVPSTFSVLKQGEDYKIIVQRLSERNISLQEVLRFDYQKLKTELGDIKESDSEKFWKEIEKYKVSQEKINEEGFDPEQFKEMIDICLVIIEAGFNYDDLQDLDDKTIQQYLIEFNQDRQTQFLMKVKKGNNSKEEKLDQVTDYFESKGVREEYSSLISELNYKCQTPFNELISMNKDKIREILNSLKIDEKLINNFIFIIEIEEYFTKNNFKEGLFSNLFNHFIQKKLFLENLYNISKTQDLELYLFLSVSGLMNILPQNIVETFSSKKLSLSNLLTLSNEELVKLGLNEAQIKLLTNSFNILKQCSLRRFSLFELDYIFLGNICSKGITINEIDKWSEKDFDQLGKIPMKDKTIQLLKQKSQTEIFLSDTNLKEINQNLVNNIKYIEYEFFKTWKLQDFLNIDKSLVKQAKEIMKNFSTYDTQNKFNLNNPFINFQKALKELKFEKENENEKEKLKVKEKEKPLVSVKPEEYEKRLVSLNAGTEKYKEELNKIYQEYAKNLPKECDAFYKKNREKLQRDLDFFIDQEYFLNLIRSLKEKLIDSLSDIEKNSNKQKIESIFKLIEISKEELKDILFLQFGKSKNVSIIVKFLVLIDETIPMLLDKYFPAYIKLIVKYKENNKIIDILVEMNKELTDVKDEESFLKETRKLIEELNNQGEEFIKEVYDEFTDLENYLYFSQDSINKNPDIIQNKIISLLKKIYSDIGPLFLDNFIRENKSLSNLKNIALQDSTLIDKVCSLEFYIQKVNNDCGEFVKNMILKEFPDLQCTKHIKPDTFIDIKLILNELNNQIDPYFLDILTKKYPELKMIEINKKKEDEESIADLLESLNKDVGYFCVEQLFKEIPELKLIDLKINPNKLSDVEIKQLSSISFNSNYVKNKNEESKNNGDELKEKLNKKSIYEMKIKQKIINKNSRLKEVDEIFSKLKEPKEKIIKLRTIKNQLQDEILQFLGEKNSRIEKIKEKVPKMKYILENLFKLLEQLMTIDKKIIKEFYNIYPHMNNIISLPKNKEDLIREEIIDIQRLLSKHRETPYEISDLLKINHSNDQVQKLQKIIVKFEKKESIEELIVALFFDCIKRKEIFSEKIRKIQQVLPKFKINSSNLLEYLISNSKSNLKIMLLHICSKFIPIPFLIKRLEIPKENPDGLLKESYHMNPELALLLEDSSTNLLSICLSQNKQFYPKGKSHLLNFCFGRSFITYEKIITKTKVEFQFDYHYANPMNFNIADYHGIAKIDIIENLVPFFNYYFLHLKSEELESHNETISKLIKKIKEKHSSFVFIVFLQQQKFEKIEIKQGTDSGVFYIKIQNIRPMNEDLLKNLKDDIWKIISTTSVKERPFYYTDNVKHKYLEVCEKYCTKEKIKRFYEKLNKIQKFIDYLMNFKNDFQDSKLLPFSQTFADFSEHKKYLHLRYNEMTEENKKKVREELQKKYEIHQKQQITPIVKHFNELLYDKSFLGILLDSSARVKSNIEKELKETYLERNELIKKISKCKDEKQKEELEIEKEKKIDLIQKKSFSYELIVRELFFIYKNEKINVESDEKRYFQKISDQLISCGQPFEIIDGDNLNYISDFYPNLFRTNRGNVLVVSIIGPQSSGKSTLLNFLFGTQFASSSGRCTKGMYGCIMDLKDHPKYNKLLILDTEGILSAERDDHLFDKKLILFCLCVSHVTILCNKGDIHKGMTDVLKLVTECMKDLKEQKFIDPQIYVVLNALTDINEKLMVPIQNLGISLTGVKMLPFAFELKDVLSEIKAQVPSTDFSQKCLDFRMEIINRQNNEENKNHYSLKEWFEFSQNLWEKIDKFRNLINYVNIEELNQDRELGNIIEDLIKDFKRTMDKQPGDNYEIKKIVDNECKDFDLPSFKVITKKTYLKIDHVSLQIKENLTKRFETECMNKNIRSELMNKRKILLEKNMNMVIEDWKSLATNLLNELKIKFSRAGDHTLTKELIELINKNNKKPYSKEKALQLFESFWQRNIIDCIWESIGSVWERKEECFRRVRDNYECCTTQVINDDKIESDLKIFFEKRTKDIIINVFEKNELFYFIEGSLPEIDKLYDTIKKEHSYFNLKKDLVRRSIHYEVVKINIKENFNKLKFSKDLQKAINKAKNNWFSTKEEMLKESLKKYLEKLEKECSRLYHDFEYDDTLIKSCCDILFPYLKMSNANSNIENDMIKVAQMLPSKFKLRSKISFKEDNGFFHYFENEKLYNYKPYLIDENQKIVIQTGCILVKEKKIYEINRETDEKLKEMLNWYIEPNNPSNYMTQERRKNGIRFIQKQMNWENLIERIFLFVFKSVCKDTKLKNVDFLKELQYIQNAIDNKEDINKYIQNFSDWNTQVIKSLIKETEYLINNINLEIQHFRFQINQGAIGIFHESVLTIFWTFYTVMDIYKAYEPERINNRNKESLKELYVSVLTKDSITIDKKSANLIIDQILDNLYHSILLFCQESFRKEMTYFGSQMNSENTMKYLDEFIEKSDNQNIDQILQLMLNPKEKLEELFENVWENKRENTLNNLHINWNNYVKNKLNVLYSFFKEMLKKLKEEDLMKESIYLFDVFNNKVIEENVEFTYEKEMENIMGSYLFESIRGTWQFKEKTLNEIGPIKLRLKKPLPNLEGIKDETLRKWMLDYFKDKSIINFQVFLPEIISIIEKELQICETKLPDNNLLDKENQKKTYYDIYIGCQIHCRLCGRKCDQTHKSITDRHKCNTGHQFKVFGGSKFQDYFPSFICCNEMKDNDEIIYEGNIIKWSEFKSLQMNDWDYESEFFSDFDILERNKKIWSKIGKQVCEHYTKKGNEIIYSDYQQRKNTSFPRLHLILLLDDSGSMSCRMNFSSRWDELIKAVKDIFKVIEGNLIFKKRIKISVFVHSSYTINCFLTQEVDLNLIDKIQPRFGGTNFEDALTAGYDCILKTKNDYDVFSLGFLTDGDCYFPHNIIDRINKDPEYINNLKNKIRFNTILFDDSNSGSYRLKEIAKSLNGTFCHAITFDDLKGSFKEIIKLGFK